MSAPPSTRPVLSTMWAGNDPLWDQTVEVIDARHYRWLVAFLADVVRKSRGRRAVVLRGTVTLKERYRDLLAAIVLRATRSPVRVVVSDATIEPGSRALADRLGRLAPLLPLLARLLVRAADGRRTTWCVLSRAEVDSFASAWRVPRDHITFTPFSHTLHSPQDREGATAGDYLFSGGNSLRRYDLLADAAEGLGVDVVVATSWRPDAERPWLNAEPVPHQRFVELLKGCRAMVLPIAESTRSAGQQTYLNAMALGKVVVVTDGLGVRDHIEDGVTGVVVAPTVEALRAALTDLLDPARADHYAAMGVRAREVVLDQYSPDAYRRSLLRLAGLEV